MTTQSPMRLAWCTPFTPMSAIGQFSAQVVAAIRESLDVDVDLFYPAKAGGRTFPDKGEELGSDPESVLSDYDAVVYNIGDNPDNHGALVSALRVVPGLVVLHDVSLINLVVPYLLEAPEREVLRAVDRWYGEAGVAMVTQLRADLPSTLGRPEIVERFP